MEAWRPRLEARRPVLRAARPGRHPIHLTAALRSASPSLVGAHLQCFALHSAEVLEHGRGFLHIDRAPIECALVERRRDMLLEHWGAETILRTAHCGGTVCAFAAIRND